MDNFKWNRYRDCKPNREMFIYVSVDDPIDEIEIGKWDEFEWDENMLWGYVYVPDVPKSRKLEECETLKDCSNNYILRLERRIETLEKQMRNLE